MATHLNFQPCVPPSPLSPTHHRRRHHNNSKTATTRCVSLTEPKSSTTTISISPLQNLLKSLHSAHPNTTPLPPSDDPKPLSTHHRHLLRLAILHNDISIAKAVHSSILKQNTNIPTKFNSLIATYIKLKNLNYAHKCFTSLSFPEIISYTTIISAFAKSDRQHQAVNCFFKMRVAGIRPNEFTYVAILTACIKLLDMHLGSQIHALLIKSNYICSTYVYNALMALYLKCGQFDRSTHLFDEMANYARRDLASWNTIISGLVKASEYERAFELSREMTRRDGFSVDYFTLSTLLVASMESFDCMKGRECHAHALKTGFGSNLSVNNTLLGFYTKCGYLDNVVDLFERVQQKDVITWTAMVVAFMEFGRVESAMKTFVQIPGRSCISYNALLAGFCQNGEGLAALELFQGMLERGLELSEFSLTSIVNACALLTEVEMSKQVHGFVTKFGYGSNPWIEAALLDMCTRCGRMDDAEKMFHRWSYKQDTSLIWTSMIIAYVRNGEPERAASFFCEMCDRAVVVDEVAATTALGICGSLGSDDLGKQIHCYVHKSGLLSDLGVSNAIISMYSKCGYMEDAVKAFNLMPNHNIVSWNSLISGYLLHRHGDKALAVWLEMGRMHVQPDSLTFVLILSAYRHTSTDLLEDCRRLFNSMKSIYDMEHTSDHYAAMVGVLGFWGRFSEAKELISNMHFEPNDTVWRALLDSCRLRSKTELGKRVAEHLVAMEPQDPSTYILVSNLYAASGRWNCFERIRNEMREKGFRKQPSRSWLIHQNKVHSFYGRDKSHPESKEIYGGLSELIQRCMKAGYVPDTSFVLHDVEKHQKKEFLFYHSAKLAVTYGVLYTRTVRVVKNIDLCGDCHTFFKYASTVLGREISFRDASGFHVFKNGKCSCKDYW